MPPEMAVSMRHTKLKAEEAALLAGEINKPSWESRNEGIHERVSFEDSIWGFDLAGGSFYKTPLRVTYVKPDSRAAKAGIRPGDKLLRINDIDTSTLTIQEAHDIIIKSGIHLRLSVTAPEDEEDAYYCYQDPLVDGYDSDEERRLAEERARKRQVHAKVSSFWSLQWPWVSKRRLIYRESNCFMVNSKYEEARRDKYPPLPVLRYTDDIVHFHKEGDEEDKKKQIPTLGELKEKTKKEKQQRLANGNVDSEATVPHDEQPTQVSEGKRPANHDANIPPIIEENDNEELSEEHETEPTIEEPEEADEKSIAEVVNGDINQENGDINEENDTEMNEVINAEPETAEESVIPETEEENKEIDEEMEEVPQGDDEVINEVFAKSSSDNLPRNEEDNILDSILSDEGQNLESSEENNER